MDVQKYIKRLKFARADMSRATGPFETRDEAIDFLNQREFFFGDPFVVKYKDREDNGEVKLLLAIGKSENPEITSETSEVIGATGPDAYELIDVNDVKDELEKLWKALNEEISARTEADVVLQENIDAEASARTAADEALQEQINEVKESIDSLNELVSEISGATADIEEIVGEGWTDSPDNVTITDRIKRDEKLAGIVWGHNDDEPYDGNLPNTHLKYASGDSLAEMLESVSETLSGVLFEDGNVTKSIKFDYNSERNILYYTAGTETGEIELSQAAVVEDAYYDKETEELVIIFKLGEGKTQEVRIPIGDLIEEWDVADTDTVHLNKERSAGAGADVLSADVKISDDADNMLVAKADGLYVSNSGLTKIEAVVGTLKEDIAVLEDGHFPTDYFSGSTVNGSTNLQEALLKLDAGLAGAGDAINALSEDVEAKYDELNDKIDVGDATLASAIDLINSELPKLKSEVKLADDVSHLTLESGFSADGHVFYELGESDIASESAVNDAINGLQTQIDGLGTGIADEVAARESIELIEIPQQQLEPDVRSAYVLSNNGVTGSTVIKIFKDSVIYKIYFGHVDDQITSPTDPTVIPGTGATAICFIYFNANGEYELATEKFEITDQLWEALDEETASRIAADEGIMDKVYELRDVVEEEQSVAAIAINKLAEAISDIANEFGESINEISGSVLTLSDKIDLLGNELSNFKDSVDEFEGEVEEKFTALDEKASLAITGVTNQAESAVVLTKESDNTVSGDVKISTEANNMLEKLSDGNLFVNNSGVTRANELCDTLSGITGNFRQLLNTNEDGHFTARFLGPHTSTAETYYNAVNALDNAITAAEDAARATDNSFELDYDDQAQEIMLRWQVDGSDKVSRIDVSDFVKDSFLESVNVVNHEGVQCLEFRFKTYDGEPLPIYVPLDDLAVIYKDGDGIDRQALENDHIIKVKLDETRKNWLSVSPNGLFVTGVSEAIEEAVSGFTHLVEEEAEAREAADNEILAALNREVADRSAADAVLQNNIDSESSARESADSELRDDLSEEASNRASEDNALHEEIDGLYEIITGLTGQTFDAYVRKDEVEDHLDSASTLPVQNAVVTEAMNDLHNEIEEVIDSLSAITADTIVVNDLTADSIYADEYKNLPTATTSQYGVVILDDHLDSGSTNPVENAVVTSAIGEINDAIDGINGQISAITENGLYDVVIEGSGNVVTSIEKDGNNVVATLGSISFDVDDYLDSASTNPVENRVLYQLISDDEEVVAAAFNDLNDKKAEKTDLEDLANELSGEIENLSEQVENSLSGVEISGTGNVVTSIEKQGNSVVATLGSVNVDVDDHFDTGSTNPVENQVVATAINNLEEAIQTLSGGGLTGVTTTGSGNAVVSIAKDGQSVKATLGTISDMFIATYGVTTCAEIASAYDAGKHVIAKYTDPTDVIFYCPLVSPNSPVEFIFATTRIWETDEPMNLELTINSEDGWLPAVSRILEGTDNKVTSITSASTNSEYPSAKAIYDNYYTKADVDAAIAGITFDVDDTLDSGSTNPVANSAVTITIIRNELVTAAAFNDLNDRKADLDDVPTSINELDGVNTLATKSELGDYLPLSGGTLTGGLSGTTVSADTFNSQTGFFQTSDERYKIFMGDVENAIEKANSIPTRYFYWKDRYDGPRYLGTSAQKVQEVFPELVKEEGDKLSVDYAGLSIVALAAIKELTAKVDELQRQIDELKK